MAQFGAIITSVGLAKIANAQITNTTLGIESMILGDGNGAYYTVSQNQKSLRREVWRGLLADQRVDTKNPNRIEFSAFIPSTVGGFNIREVGLLDTDGNLIAVSLYPEQYKPTLNEGISDDLLINFVIETTNADVITLAVDATNVIATRQYVDKNMQEVDQKVAQVTQQLAQVAIGNIEQSTRLQAYEHARIIDNKQSFRQGIVTISNNSQSVGGWFKSAASFATVAFGGSGQVDTNYTIALDVVSGDKSAIGDLRVHDRTLNGFKIGYSGSAKNATIAWALINKEGAKL